MAKGFKGDLAVESRDSTPDSDAFLTERAPVGSPNVPVVLFTTRARPSGWPATGP
jgi:hypothetical protein